VRLREGPADDKGPTLKDARAWALKQAQNNSLVMAPNEDKTALVLRRLTPDEKWQWAELAAELSARIGDKRAERRAREVQRQVDAERPPEFTETPLPGI
jgi:hypothetical protein